MIEKKLNTPDVNRSSKIPNAKLINWATNFPIELISKQSKKPSNSNSAENLQHQNIEIIEVII